MEIKIKPDEASSPGKAAVSLVGHVDEDVKHALSTLETQVKTDAVVFDCESIGKINSVGIKDWIFAFERFDKLFESSYERCSMAFVDVAMMVPSFTKSRQIKSFFSCFQCEPCKIETPILIELDDGVGVAPSPPTCGRCGMPMLADEDVEEVLDFLRDRATR